VSAGIVAPIFFVIFVAVLALFPELTLLLSAPAIVAGCNALFGLGIAVPIIQSLIRHVEAGGFGAEVAAGDQNWLD
jgi:ABC-type polysaccharide/polyol phosphate export permease